MRAAIEALRERFGAIALSPIYESRAVGFDGDAFLNCVAAFDTALPPAQVAAALHAIEADHGRRREGPRFGPRTLDLDLLLYGDEVSDNPVLPRPEILEYDFVLRPLADLVPAELHPRLRETYESLWHAFAGERTALRRMDLSDAQSRGAQRRR